MSDDATQGAAGSNHAGEHPRYSASPYRANPPGLLSICRENIGVRGCFKELFAEMPFDL